LHEAASQLGAVVTQKFDEAVHAEDLASVERFFKIFPLLGMQDEGLDKFSSYLCSKVILLTRSTFHHNYSTQAKLCTLPVTSLCIEGKQMHMPYKPRTLLTKEMRQ
jgi:hypothetical protein